MNIVPLEIRLHLIPFLYKEFEGVEYQYLKEKVKVCKIDAKSSFGFTVISTLKKVYYPVKPNSKFYVYIGINIDSVTAKMYKLENYEVTWNVGINTTDTLYTTNGVVDYVVGLGVGGKNQVFIDDINYEILP